MKENDILNPVREYLRIYKWFVIRHQQGLGCHKGLSDLTAIRDGVVVWIEIKTPKGKLSAEQKRFKADIESHGGIYLVARGIEDVEHLGGGLDGAQTG